ncbi:ABC transporter ATP-binding protein [Rhodanobacter sp. 7MK24]|uniref:ABC transporter ATP-binding protein n=1 Tax=Rhodanobacter sp. 7MK24 TaxID=2775922 RepID=UPI001784B498|nr:ABC transporter ATP-binding protein [Rhodanobacter sp. 7MK24]MBD8881718.1 ABC transporter ATP-binding protein [Rhodanobacter sp. 7MK24]
MQEEPARGQDRATAPEPPAPSSSLLDELNRLASAARRLFGAQLQLLAAELGLARSAVSWLLVAALVATVAGVALGLTLLGMIGALLAVWFHSWIWALLVLALLQVLLLAGAVAMFRRCMRWMSLPATRREWNTMMRETMRRAESDIQNDGAGEGRP